MLKSLGIELAGVALLVVAALIASLFFGHRNEFLIAASGVYIAYREGIAPSLQGRMSDCARRAFAERWSEPVALERYFALIRQVARARGARRVSEILGAAG